MNVDEAKKIVISVITNALEGKSKITENMQLIGSEILLDSELVEVALPKDLADEQALGSLALNKVSKSKHV